MKHKNPSRMIAAMLFPALLSVLFFSLLYRVDNKYTTATPQPRNGILTITNDTLAHHPVLYLVNGWELFPGLLTPEDIQSDPLRYRKNVYIGQHTGFDALGQSGRSGAATLRLNIFIPEASRQYAMELPEIYSAYRLYVNGELLCEMGDPSESSYQPRIGNRQVMFLASGRVELVLAMANYSHIYSGLVYPPAFGQPEAVGRLLATRLSIRSWVGAIAFALGVFYLALGLILLRKRESGGLAALYGLLCLCFVGYTAYPVVKTLLPGGLAWYIMENFCYCAMLLLVMLAANRLCCWRGRAARAIPAFGAVICACTLLTPLIAKAGWTTVRLWSFAISLYFILCAMHLTIAAASGLRRGVVRSYVMLGGALVFDVALVMDRLLPDFEPIYTGWFSEWAGLALVICTGVLILQDILHQYRQRQALEENMDSMHRLMDAQQAFYPMVMEQAALAKAAHHDLRHHLTAIGAFADKKDNDGLCAYLGELGAVPTLEPSAFCANPTLNVLLGHFAARAKAAGVRFSARADVAVDTGFKDTDLFAICANLLENALEAATRLPQPQQWIDLGIRQDAAFLAIVVENTFDGVVEQRGERLLSRKAPGREGIGTASVRRIAQRCAGSANFYWTQEAQGAIFHADILLPNQEERQAATGNL